MFLDIESVRSRLPDRRIDWHASIGSTMIEASRLAASGCEWGTVVGAEEQTAGQGRYGRAWHSEAGSGLYVSIVLRCPDSPDVLPLVTLALGLAAVDAILKATDLDCDLRWPNDLLIQSKEMRRHPDAARRFGYHCRHRHQRESIRVPGPNSARSPLRCESRAAACIRANGCWWSCWEASIITARCSKPRAASRFCECSPAHPVMSPAGAWKWTWANPCCKAPRRAESVRLSHPARRRRNGEV